jgi:hypothetical protein
MKTVVFVVKIPTNFCTSTYISGNAIHFFSKIKKDVFLEAIFETELNEKSVKMTCRNG